jgi:pyruvate, water dikinase
MIRSLFSKFQMILDVNTKLLEKMASMERALGGEYIFDRAFLESSVSETSHLVYQVVYSLNAMTENRFSDLFDHFQVIKTYLEDILSGGPGPYAGRLTLPYPAIRMEMQPLVGLLSAGLAEFGHHMGLCTPDGFAVTTTGIDMFMRGNDLHNKIRQIISEPRLPDRYSRITALIKNADIQDALAREIADEVRGLSDRIGKNILLTVTAGTIENESLGQSPGIYNVAPAGILEACKQSIAVCVAKATESGSQEDHKKDISMAVAVHEMIRPEIAGTVCTLDSTHLPPHQMARVTVIPDDSLSEDKNRAAQVESFLVQRFYPFEPVESVIRPRAVSERLPGGKRSLSVTDRGLRRGSSLIRKDALRSLAESAMAVERTLGKPQKVCWAQEETGRIIITGVGPLSDVGDDDVSMEKLNEQIGKATLLIEGGETAQMGIAAGRVVHVTQDCRYDSFPLGAIAVAGKASPLLSAVLRRAAGLITETGSSVGHLASIARELRIPAIMGIRRALELLKEGMVVTMDAGDRKIYRGILELLVQYRSSGVELYPTDPEYITLRQLLRWIIPLNLVDPDSADFKPGNCRTLHDIIHFAHEMAVEELLNIQSRHKGFKKIATRRLALTIPMDIRVMDIGNGLFASKEDELRPDDISSLPFKAFLRGITMKEMWDQRPSSIGLREIFTGMDRTYAALNNPPEYSGQNLAIASENYLNLTLRLGYHFNVINAYMSENQNKNFIYYRFVGGFAQADRRARRAQLIAAVLENMDFKVTVDGDLVIGKLKIADQAYMESALLSLGELTGFTRQLDVKMKSEKDVDEFTGLFTERTRNNHAQ